MRRALHSGNVIPVETEAFDRTLAGVVDIAFNAQGRLEHCATIAPGKFIEVCGRLPQGSRIAWSFETQVALLLSEDDREKHGA